MDQRLDLLDQSVPSVDIDAALFVAHTHGGSFFHEIIAQSLPFHGKGGGVDRLKQGAALPRWI
ncbi:MAG: hypothetical protein C6I00_03490 [Nitratiruptor sp.]|nr:hypothetical protein [Nitratiruptor sp.]